MAAQDDFPVEPLQSVQQLREAVQKLPEEVRDEITAHLDTLEKDVRNKIWNASQEGLRWRSKYDEESKAHVETQKANRHLERVVHVERQGRLYDALTGLYARDYFKRELVLPLFTKACRERRKRDRRAAWTSFWVVDLDDFKAINDTFGHDVGDVLLRRAGRILRISIRFRTREDVAGRVGGDEFQVCMPQTTVLATDMAAKKYRERFRTRKWHAVHPELSKLHMPNLSIGVACLRVVGLEHLPNDERDLLVRNLFRRADQLMYESKKHDEVYLRCYEYNPEADGRIVEVDPEVIYLEMEEDRRHASEHQ